MKKILLSAVVLICLAANATERPSEVTAEVLKAFKQTFTQAQDVTWYEYEDYFQVNFKQDDIQIRAQYNADGTLLRTMRYYGEKQLLPNIVAELKKKYGNKEVYGVTETTSADEVSFIISLKDNTHWYVVKSDIYGHLDQTDKFKRADK